jgi:hypothetical protein
MPSPAVLLSGWTAGVAEVSRLVHEVYRRVWGLRLRRTETGARANAPAHVAFRALRRRRRPDLQFSELDIPPRLSPVYASPSTSRYPVQNSGPSGSLVLFS